MATHQHRKRIIALIFAVLAFIAGGALAYEHLVKVRCHAEFVFDGVGFVLTGHVCRRVVDL